MKSYLHCSLQNHRENECKASTKETKDQGNAEVSRCLGSGIVGDDFSGLSAFQIE
tara:strand:+ start:321853 stop:322017 length:165 start_codon:yes stop_codon:yes gene_type:complete